MTPAANCIGKPAAPAAAAILLRPLPPLPVRRAVRSQASAFALALHARRARANGPSPALDLVHRHLPALRWSRAIHQHWQLGFAPQLRLQFAGDTWLAPTPPSALLPAAGAASPSPPTFVSTGTTLERLLLRSQRTDSLRTLERIVHAATLQGAAEPAPQPSPPTQARAELRVERVYRDREIAARQLAKDTVVAAPNARAVDAAITSSRDSAPSPANARAPDVDIQRLADRVVNAIDRRLTAHRERLGRS